MPNHPKDIYTEPTPDADTLANLGPLAPMAGIWTSAQGLDVNPKADGPERQPYIERIELQPIDAQTNGPQLFYGLRYHTHILKPDEAETLHDQVGYWLWEPATGTVIQTLSIPRGQTAMAVGQAAADAKSFRLEAVRGSTVTSPRIPCGRPIRPTTTRTRPSARSRSARRLPLDDVEEVDAHAPVVVQRRHDRAQRSEERRVGKECEVPCRSRWAPYH